MEELVMVVIPSQREVTGYIGDELVTISSYYRQGQLVEDDEKDYLIIDTAKGDAKVYHEGLITSVKYLRDTPPGSRLMGQVEFYFHGGGKMIRNMDDALAYAEKLDADARQMEANSNFSYYKDSYPAFLAGFMQPLVLDEVLTEEEWKDAIVYAHQKVDEARCVKARQIRRYFSEEFWCETPKRMLSAINHSRLTICGCHKSGDNGFTLRK